MISIQAHISRSKRSIQIMRTPNGVQFEIAGIRDLQFIYRSSKSPSLSASLGNTFSWVSCRLCLPSKSVGPTRVSRTTTWPPSRVVNPSAKVSRHASGQRFKDSNEANEARQQLQTEHCSRRHDMCCFSESGRWKIDRLNYALNQSIFTP